MSVIGAQLAKLLAFCAPCWCCGLFGFWYSVLYSIIKFLISIEKIKLAWYLQYLDQASVNYQ
ncbi:hypothetical protein CBP51_06265 [Cellvibrio mixtus]|uniref:Uncharacterized protein n=1 Tax=Cellvibrio mixtus TaxID=39650 RepID=A0A266Q9W5_9GAMM|nr:hypothetical protein CBP51_06265 [Cellvibrio mixtus]